MYRARLWACLTIAEFEIKGLIESQTWSSSRCLDFTRSVIYEQWRREDYAHLLLARQRRVGILCTHDHHHLPEPGRLFCIWEDVDWIIDGHTHTPQSKSWSSLPHPSAMCYLPKGGERWRGPIQIGTVMEGRFKYTLATILIQIRKKKEKKKASASGWTMY